MSFVLVTQGMDNIYLKALKGGQSRTAEAANLAYSYLVLGPLVVLYWRGTFNYISTSTFHDGNFLL